MARLYLIGTTDTTASVGISGMDGDHAYKRYFRWYLNGSHVDTTTSPPFVTGTSYDYDGLTASTRYSLSVGIYHSDNAILLATLGPISPTTDAPPAPDGAVRICLGGSTWVNATPYICLGGTSWVVATPYVCLGGTTWVPTT